MYKMILQDYRSHFQSSLKRIWNNSALCFVWLFYCLAGIGSHEDNELSYIFITIPCIIAYMLARMYGGYLNKTFFLCPLDTSLRRKYAMQSFKLRIIIPSILFLIGNIILMLCGVFFIDIFVIRMIVFACTAISVNIYHHPKATTDWTDTNRYPFVGNFETTNTYSHIINIIMIIITMYMNEYSISELATWEIVIVTICITLQLIATLYKAKHYYRQSIMLMDFYQ